MSAKVTQIAAASAEQGEGIEAVNRTVNQLDAVTQQNAALVEEASAAAASMEDQAVQLRDALRIQDPQRKVIIIRGPIQHMDIGVARAQRESLVAQTEFHAKLLSRPGHLEG